MNWRRGLAGLAIAVQVAACEGSAPAYPPAFATYCPYMVFFDFDSAAITRQAASTIREVAAAFRSGDNERVEIVASTDRAGDVGYNLALSYRRGEAIKAELVRNGIAARSIEIRAVGETRPLVQTIDGVREPQNRNAVFHLVRKNS